MYICVADIHSNTLLLLTSNTSVDKYMYNTCNLRVVDGCAVVQMVVQQDISVFNDDFKGITSSV